MSLTIGSNIASLQGARRLSETRNELSSVYEKLSSGLRINRASDDAAGLAISSSLQADSRVYGQGIRNLNDGISALNIAEGALDSLTNIVTRLSELTSQAANGTLGTQQRKSLDLEAQALSQEYFRIARSTRFNGRMLFGGEYGELRLQAGYGTDGGVAQTLGGAIGTGTFGTMTTYVQAAGLVAVEVALKDLNGDGHLDQVSGISSGLVTVSFGDGNGSFGAVTNVVASGPGTITGLVLGDVNNDGIQDLVTNGANGLGYANVRLGTGSGNFGAAISYAAMETDVTLGDLNGDGSLDMVTVGTGATGRVSVRLGRGDGTFGSVSTFSMDQGSSDGVALGDLNNDGVLDLVTSGIDFIGTASVRYGLGDGNFGSLTTYGADGIYSPSLALGDVNNDGRLDIVTAGNSAPGSSVSILLGSSSGFGGPTTYYSTAGTNFGVALADTNGDGFLDILSSGPNLQVRIGNGNGTFLAAVTYSTELGGRDVQTGDLNEDGVVDVVSVGVNAGPNAAAYVRLGSAVAGASPLLPFSLRTMADARQAMPLFTQKLDQLGKQRGQIGAFQSRINVASATLLSTRENYIAAASRITDADIAKESSDLVRLGILEKAGAAVLGQANLQPKIALTLLGFDS